MFQDQSEEQPRLLKRLRDAQQGRIRERYVWLGVVTAIMILMGGTFAYAASILAPGNTFLCTQTSKDNGGTVLDCDPYTAPTASPSNSPSSTPSLPPTATPTSPAPTSQPVPTATSPGPTATPTVTSPVPSDTTPPTTRPPGRTTDCLNHLAECGLPNAANTGPNGSLATSTQTQYTIPNTVVSNVRINGCVEVRAANVTFRNVQFVGTNCHYLVRNLSTGLRIEDAEANCNNGGNSAMAGPGGFSVARVDIHNCENGFDLQAGNVAIQDSWIHDMYTGGSAHTDGVQIGQGSANIVISHNTIDVRGNSTSAIIMWDEENPQNSNVTIANNMMAGGSYTLYCGREGTAVNVRITGNRFGPNTFGYANSCNSGGEIWTNNRRDSDNAVLPAT